MNRFRKPSPESLRAVQLAAARRLSADELRERLAPPLTEEEREEALALLRWFRRRYPTPAERLAHARRLAKAWLDPASPLGAPAPTRLPEDPIQEPPGPSGEAHSALREPKK
jgi:hypothetical protein